MLYYNLMTDFKIIRSSRKTLALEVRSDLSVIVRAPLAVSEREIQKFIEERKEWLDKHMCIMSKRMQEEAQSLPAFTETELRELAQKALAVIPCRASRLAAAIGVDYKRITIRNQLTRWGSCSSLGNLNFNCLLMLCPDEVIDYVIIHELCHRRHMNHSADFWREVEKYCPSYKKCKEYLKREGTTLIKRLK